MLLESLPIRTPLVATSGTTQKKSCSCMWNGLVQIAFWSAGRFLTTPFIDTGDATGSIVVPDVCPPGSRSQIPTQAHGGSRKEGTAACCPVACAGPAKKTTMRKNMYAKREMRIALKSISSYQRSPNATSKVSNVISRHFHELKRSLRWKFLQRI
jgi:hypothetical protein